MHTIELIYVMERLWVADSDDGWDIWVGVWGGAGNSTWIGGTSGDDRVVMGMTMVMGKTTWSWDDMMWEPKDGRWRYIILQVDINSVTKRLHVEAFDDFW